MPNNHLAYHTSPLSQPKALFVPKVKQLLRALPVTNHRINDWIVNDFPDGIIMIN